MLRFQRWAPIRQRRVAWANRLRKNKNDKAIENFKSQEQFARRYGLRLLTFLMNLVLYSMLITAAYWTTLTIYSNGGFQVPDSSDNGMNALQSPK